MKMLCAVFGLLSFLILSTAVVGDPANETAIHDVISRQLEAINKDDSTAAFAFASPDIQKLFGDSATFMTMVRRGYPQIYRSKGHKFLNIDTSTGQLMQRVLIEGDKGSVVVKYDMIEIDGAWRINGCTIEKLDEA